MVTYVWDHVFRATAGVNPRADIVREGGISYLADDELGNENAYHPCLAYILEVEFITNPDADRFINNTDNAIRDGNRQTIATQIRDGVNEWFDDRNNYPVP
jgi:hypothetical protein